MTLLWDMVLRYSFQGRRKGFSRLVARASMLGMVLGVASLITVMSIMNGFAGELYGRLLALVPHAHVQPVQGQIDDWEALSTSLTQAMPEIKGIAPAISDSVLFEAWGRHRGVQLVGIDVAAQHSVSDLHQRLIAGDVAALETSPLSVIIGATLGHLLGLSVGDTVRVTLPTLSITPLGVFPRTATLRIVGIFEVGADLDAKQAWVSLETARRLFRRQGVDRLQLEFADRSAIDRNLAPLQALLAPDYELHDWRVSQGALVKAVTMEKITVALLLLAVVAVAAFNIVSTLTMSVTEKQRDIAMLRVLGVRSSGILWVFVGHGVLLGGLGIALGAAIGVLLSCYISDLAAAIEGLLGVPLFDPRIYYIGRLPSDLQWHDVAYTVLGAMLLCVLATVYPAWRAARIHPIEALNYG